MKIMKNKMKVASVKPMSVGPNVTGRKLFNFNSVLLVQYKHITKDRGLQ